MGLFKNMMDGFTNGLVSAAVDRLRTGSSQGHTLRGQNLIERMCQELGWSVDERAGNSILLHFKDPMIRFRKVVITSGENVLVFTVLSAASMNPRQLSAEIMGYLLVRNSKMVGMAWQVFESTNGNAGFSVGAAMLIDGMNSAMFKYLCETMVKEAIEFDVKMKAAGLL